jgi:hypothetical protein
VRGREEADMGPRQEEKHTLQGMKDLKKMRLSFEEERAGKKIYKQRSLEWRRGLLRIWNDEVVSF